VRWDNASVSDLLLAFIGEIGGAEIRHCTKLLGLTLPPLPRRFVLAWNTQSAARIVKPKTELKILSPPRVDAGEENVR